MIWKLKCAYHLWKGGYSIDDAYPIASQLYLEYSDWPPATAAFEELSYMHEG